jgi:ribosome biogenesis GTPase
LTRGGAQACKRDRTRDGMSYMVYPSAVAKPSQPHHTGATGQILDVSRRHVSLLTSEGILTGTIASRAVDVVTGDRVVYDKRDGRVFVTDVIPSQRTLSRSYRGDLKRMGANIDLLCVITAVGATLNPLTIDRMLIAARIQEIPAVLVVNKSDLEKGQSADIIAAYREIGIQVIECSAKFGNDFIEIERVIQRPDAHVIALCGVSGVGKSTILNRLVPGAAARTGEVSERTGQGKQTTSQPRGFLYSSGVSCRRIIIDFPGVGFFGLSHLEKERLAGAFDEFARLGEGCRFSNCRHLQEPECAVREAVEGGNIAPWRYQSYLQILDEIEDAREY